MARGVITVTVGSRIRPRGILLLARVAARLGALRVAAWAIRRVRVEVNFDGGPWVLSGVQVYLTVDGQRHHG